MNRDIIILNGERVNLNNIFSITNRVMRNSMSGRENTVTWQVSIIFFDKITRTYQFFSWAKDIPSEVSDNPEFTDLVLRKLRAYECDKYSELVEEKILSYEEAETRYEKFLSEITDLWAGSTGYVPTVLNL